MVYLVKENNNVKVAWYDGSLPSKRVLLDRTSPRHLAANGIQRRIIESSGLASASQSRETSRHDLLLRLVNAYLNRHLDHACGNRCGYQIVLFRPKWNTGDKPRRIRRAESSYYDFQRYFPEDDPLFRSAPKQEILHVRPHIPLSKDGDFFQLLATYPASPNDWTRDRVSGLTFQRKGPVWEVAGYLEIDTPSKEHYHNSPIFEEQLSLLLKHSVSVHLGKRSVAEMLRQRDFQVIGQKTSVPLGRDT